jgi:hypothetical protein
MAERYKVIFEGAATKDFGVVGQLTRSLQNQCHLTTQAVTKMMRLAPLTVKNGVDLKEAQRYQRALEGMGAKVRIELVGEDGDLTSVT